MKKNEQLIQIAIDGPAGSGKSTVAHEIAVALTINYLSSGKIFRSYAFALKDIDWKNEKEVKTEFKKIKFRYEDGDFYINTINVTNDIESDNLSIIASTVSAYPFVRKQYKKAIKKIIKKHSIVIDGRDIGTVIIPHATFKYYLDASPLIRAKRRAKQLAIPFNSIKFKTILEDIKKRDNADKNRKIAPLKKARDAKLIDSSNMTIQQVVDIIVKDVNSKRGLF